MSGKLKDLEKRLKHEPDNLGLKVTVAGLMREAGRSLEAVEIYRSVALAYRDQGRKQQAIAVCRSILEIAPDDVRCNALLSQLTGPELAAPPAPAPHPSVPSIARAPTPHPSVPSISLSRTPTGQTRPVTPLPAAPSRPSSPDIAPRKPGSPTSPPLRAPRSPSSPPPRTGPTSPPPRTGSSPLRSPGSPRTGSPPPRAGSAPLRTGSPPPRMGSSPPRMGSSPPRTVTIPPRASTQTTDAGTPPPMRSRLPSEPPPPPAAAARLPLEPPAHRSSGKTGTHEGPERRSSMEETPLPRPVPHHLYDRTSRATFPDLEELDTNPDAQRPRSSTGTGLAEAARKITGLINGDDDVAQPMDTRPVRRIRDEDLPKLIAPPPTGEHARMSDEDLETRPQEALTKPGGGDEEELTSPRDLFEPDE